MSIRRRKSITFFSLSLLSRSEWRHKHLDAIPSFGSFCLSIGPGCWITQAPFQSKHSSIGAEDRPRVARFISLVSHDDDDPESYQVTKTEDEEDGYRIFTLHHGPGKNKNGEKCQISRQSTSTLQRWILAWERGSGYIFGHRLVALITNTHIHAGFSVRSS